MPTTALSQPTEEPIVSGGTLRRADGALLRGARLSLDLDNEPCMVSDVPPQASFDLLRTDYGLNAIRIFAEKPPQPAGENLACVNLAIQRALNADLHVVLVPGVFPDDPQTEQWLVDFWDEYAPRYAHLPNVIYELVNEPSFQGGAVCDRFVLPGEMASKYVQPDGVNPPRTWLSMIQLLHDNIRGHAKVPELADKRLLLFTYAFFDNGPGAVADASGLVGVDWSKTAVSFHG